MNPNVKRIAARTNHLLNMPYPANCFFIRKYLTIKKNTATAKTPVIVASNAVWTVPERRMSAGIIGFTDFECEVKEGSKSEIFRRCDAGASNENE
jgi:hypothetical protein